MRTFTYRTKPRPRPFAARAALVGIGLYLTPWPVAADGPVYVPPLRGAPTVRVGGGSRGAEGAPRLEALAPPHLGRSSTDQPRLYWRISALPPKGMGLKLVVTGLRSAAPLIEQPLAAPQAPGLQRIDLARYGVHLAPDQGYRWSLVLSPEGANAAPERAVVASGMVSYVPLSVAVAAEPGRTALAPVERAEFFCRVGYWYDCMDAVAAEAIARPGAEEARKAVDALMAQLEAKTP